MSVGKTWMVQCWRVILNLLFLGLISGEISAQESMMLIPDHVFDGERMHDNWVVVVKGSTIEFAGPKNEWNGQATEHTIPGST